MRPLTGLVPVRIDLAGGTLDIWPIHLTLAEPGVTVNVALDLPARVTVAPIESGAIHLESRDRAVARRWESLDELRETRAAQTAPEAPAGGALRPGGPLDLLARAVEAVVPEGGVEVITSATSPAGAGLGGSSALLACVLATLAEAAGRPLDREAVRRWAQDLETRVVDGPTGYQDYYPPLFGGCLALEGRPAGVVVERLPVALDVLARRLRLVYTGMPHHSGLTNWGVMRAYFDGDPTTRQALGEIADLAREVRGALRRGDVDAALAGVVAEGAVRRRMAPGVATRETDAIDAAVRAAGALGTKVLGAGGGGCMLVALRDGPEPPDLPAALRAAGGRPLDCRLVETGIRFVEGLAP